MSIRALNGWAIFMLLAGCAQMAGGLAELVPLRAIGAAWGFSPYPKVFSDVRGLETFASEFVLEWNSEGRSFSRLITPEMYSELKGPYARRNVYGAALSYAPRLPDAQWQAAFCYGLRPLGPLFSEFNIPAGASQVTVRIRTKTRGRSDEWVLQPECRP